MVEKFRAEKIKKQYKNVLFLFLFIVFLIRFGFNSFASWDYNYTGGVQQFQAPTSAWYKLEVWGAQGGNQVNDDNKNVISGGKGGYAQGQVWLNQGQIIYIVVGEQGGSRTFYPNGHYGSSDEIKGADGGYNGGGKGGQGTSDSNTKRYRIFSGGAGGGGATHIATTDRGTLNNYSSAQGEILIVAGGGGGASGGISGGTGGGENGGASSSANYTAGGSQSSGYKFGTGGNGQTVGNIKDGNYNNREGRGGGGGGWYGGYGGNGNGGDNSVVGGGGGSGHLNVSNGSMENGVQEGNGFARIDYAHTHNLNITHWDNAGQRIDNGYAQHQIHRWYSCDANDGYSQEGDYYWENCYDADDNGYCDVCGRHRRWVNINVNTPDSKEDTSGNTARFNMSWHDNTALGEQQNHWEGQVSDQRDENVWVGTTIWIDNINISQSYLYLTGVTGATQSGSSYYYVVQDEEHIININTDYKSYSLTINPNGGTLNVTDGSIKKNSNGTATATVKYNQTWYCDLGVTASRTHYIMDGFYTSASGGTKLWDNGGTCYAGNGYWNSSRKWCYTGNVTVYAHWSDAPGYHNGQAIVYNLTYSITPKTGATSVTDPGNPKTYTIETPTFKLEPPSAKGYNFEGWTGTDANKSKEVTINKGSIGDRSFEAQWSDAAGYHNGKAIVYTITYTLYPKNGNNIGITAPNNPTTYTVETPTFTLENPSATNYSFEGWYGSCSNGSKNVRIKQGSIGDLHFEADWLPTKDSSKGNGHDQNLPYVKTTEIKENKVKIAA